MDVKYLYFFRGLIAFVAFSDIGTAVRAFVENKCVLNEISASGTYQGELFTLNDSGKM